LSAKGTTGGGQPGGYDIEYYFLPANFYILTFSSEVTMDVKDSNGKVLEEGDSVQVIRDLKVKGSSTTLKRGQVFKNIRLTSKSGEVECRGGKSTIVLKTQFLKKV
jgi:protein PhnA